MKILLFDNSALLEMNNDYCIEMRTGEFAKELQSLGNEVTFFGQILPGTKNTTDVFKLKANGLKVTGLKRKKSKIWSYLTLYISAIPSIYRSDFVYFFYPTAFKYLMLICWLFRKKYGLYIRGMDNLKDFDSKLFYKNAYAIFTVADTFTDYVNGVSNKGNAQTIRPMITYSSLDIIQQKDRLINKGRFDILYLGRMANDKGIIELIYAAQILKKEKITFHINLVGSGEYIDELKKLVTQLSVGELVSFIGPIFDKDEIMKCYLTHHIYILPTYHEGFPRTLYEAMIFGTPIITTFVGGIAGLMKNDCNCLEIKPKSVQSIVESIKFAIENPNRMTTLSENAKTTIEKVFEERRFSHAEDLHHKLDRG
ncbi:glycosyltransferase family 4 protein [Flavobacterium sp. A45]|uniref:glycosyltransferase family 4 protein n=1 Tax=Flavobacterium sp. A45 TaxID=1945862 RepID=UPI0009863998|nr:glycosyltransferase family 4 protein [Flavobacterium sp. A45]OOG64239.1 hypothetical protein B0E44_16295 [Flavobacterium sp. A45]